MAATPDPLRLIREVIAGMTVNVICHPDDQEAVQAAAAQVTEPYRVHVIVSGFIPAGSYYLFTASAVAP